MEKAGIIRIAVLGAESTGKTALCEALAKHYKTVWVPEYAREYFNDSDIYNYTLEDLVKIAATQINLEKKLSEKADRFLFCDTTLITLKIWAELEFGAVPEFISENSRKVTYDHYLITDNTIPWVKDELRQNKFSRDLLLQMNIGEVTKVSSHYHIITGREEDRFRSAIKIIDKLPG